MDELDMDKLVRDLAVEETISMLGVLAIKLTSKTEISITPKGTKVWRIEDGYGHGKIHIYEEKLKQFFGMAIGYCAQMDILPCWRITPGEVNVERLLSDQTHILLEILSKNFSANTKIMPVPNGRTLWPIVIYQESEDWWAGDMCAPAGVKITETPLQSFFGMNVGYNSEFDFLVLSNPS